MDLLFLASKIGSRELGIARFTCFTFDSLQLQPYEWAPRAFCFLNQLPPLSAKMSLLPKVYLVKE